MKTTFSLLFPVACITLIFMCIVAAGCGKQTKSDKFLIGNNGRYLRILLHVRVFKVDGTWQVHQTID